MKTATAAALSASSLTVGSAARMDVFGNLIDVTIAALGANGRTATVHTADGGAIVVSLRDLI